MIRVCLIGDSHLGALKRAADADAAPGWKLTFFGGHAELMQSIRVQDGALVPASTELRRKFARFSRGPDTIVLDDYDRFVIVGLRLGMRAMFDLYRGFVSDSMASRPERKYLLSDDCFLRAAEPGTAECEAMRLARLIRGATDRPVHVVTKPNLAAGLKGDVPVHVSMMYDAASGGDAPALGTLFATLCARIGAGAGVTVLPPIAAAAEDGIFNRRGFSMMPEGAARMPVLKQLGLLSHGNDLYGAQVLRALNEDGAAAANAA